MFIFAPSYFFIVEQLFSAGTAKLFLKTLEGVFSLYKALNETVWECGIPYTPKNGSVHGEDDDKPKNGVLSTLVIWQFAIENDHWNRGFCH